MKIVFLTTDDPLYLPDFFRKVLARFSAETLVVYSVPPLYKNETSLMAARKYFRTFGSVAFAELAVRVLGAKLRGNSIVEVCRKNRVQFATAENVNAPEFLEQLRALKPDVIVSVSCPQVFKKALIALPPRGILNIHGAILPHYRGVMPSFWMLANGEKRAGVSIYFVNEKIDAGDLCAQEIFDVLPQESLNDFLRRSKTIAAELLLSVLEKMQAGEIERRPLNLSEGSYYSWPNSEAVERFRAAGRCLW
jgi:methionyl-tRNA formyltransferase